MLRDRAPPIVRKSHAIEEVRRLLEANSIARRSEKRRTAIDVLDAVVKHRDVLWHSEKLRRVVHRKLDSFYRVHGWYGALEYYRRLFHTNMPRVGAFGYEA